MPPADRQLAVLNKVQMKKKKQNKNDTSFCLTAELHLIEAKQNNWDSKHCQRRELKEQKEE